MSLWRCTSASFLTSALAGTIPHVALIVSVPRSSVTRHVLCANVLTRFGSFLICWPKYPSGLVCSLCASGSFTLSEPHTWDLPWRGTMKTNELSVAGYAASGSGQSGTCKLCSTTPSVCYLAFRIKTKTKQLPTKGKTSTIVTVVFLFAAIVGGSWLWDFIESHW